MTEQNRSIVNSAGGHNKSKLQFLDTEQVKMIDEALTQLGPFGEVRIIVEKGRLRFLVVQKSIDALKWQPGGIVETGT